MRDKVRETLLSHCGVTHGDAVTIALSGGQDSVVLTELLLSLREELELELSALHIHHGLRAASDSEELWVREYCRQHQLPLTVHHLHLGQSSEAEAREARYRIFAQYDKVATAHHLDDCMETFLINLCRGSGSKGLSSIPHRREGIIRPMLDISKDDICAYAKEHNLCWVEDESNSDTYYLRNFMRHRILPELKAREDISFVNGFAASLKNLRQEAECLDTLAACYQSQQRADILATLPRPLLWRVLKKRCPALNRERFEVIATRLGQGAFTEQIAGEIFARVHKNKLHFITKLPPIELTELRDTVELEDKTVEIREIYSQFTHSDIDCDTIKGKLYLRSKRSGDRFCPAGHQTDMTLGRYFQKKQITDKDRRVVITDGERILYAEGLGAHKDVAPTSQTNKALRIIIRRKI
ncbi:MAG: tRNA lysidine(34) synthetase TilS [Clostridia bacterium]|nr:tRNA lysidine(34) synthetase TilS [Clostridia bacterium]